MKVDIDAFRVLTVLVEKGSFAAAAESLHKAQSAVSYQIKKLEQELGIQLLDRSQYRAQLTPEGKVILKEGQRLLRQWDNIRQLASRFGEGWEPKLELVIDGALPMEPVMTALKRMAEHQVPTKIQLNIEYLGGVQHRFLRDSADVMLVKELHTGPEYHATPLPQVTSVLVVAASHALAVKTQVTLSELQQFVELTIEDSSGITGYRDDMQFGGDKVFYLSDFMMKKNAILKGLGFGWMPDYLVEQQLASAELVEVDFIGGSRYPFIPQLVWSQQRPLGRAGQLFTQLLLEECGNSFEHSPLG
ncbi:LysR family transcriptional regulator [Shewanella sp. NIFS-20-20]|uniref:LysR family transcriptional regulator n=1 Tax=Shewanella sp. NIFS-20-20 TaxID=2853806 RepID=UPI001C491376|nr:LysR family transcriptional regulator [Shewanella sp. NIFS-20-20]MBV7314315.1 LysR family transcriptional regulator [Shewanella sp. NIFS-20-20]